MDTTALKKFAQEARRELLEVVSTKVDYYLNTDNVEIRAKEQQVNELKEEVQKLGKDQLVEKVAYTWFNRFCAIRFMDVNAYTPVGILTPAEGHTQPEIFQEAKEGHVRDDFGSQQSRKEILDLIGGVTASSNPHLEAYRKLFIASCNYFHSMMPFLFEKIEDYSELLLPDDLLSEDSILERVRQAITKENCEDVEIIGWLYQFYISEKKDEVFEDLKNNKKVTPENIPAATQLFTPGWIVKYLVENSLGKLWMLNNPCSSLQQKMAFYVNPDPGTGEYLKISSPEEIKICDPACGSGHMLTYAFELLFLIYEEEGYEPTEIPSSILKNNLFGMEIDDRAGELAAFALIMKARSKQRSFFKKGVQPNICVLKNIHFDNQELQDYIGFIGEDLFSQPLMETLLQFDKTNNLGSLIVPKLENANTVCLDFKSKNVSGELFLQSTHERVLDVLDQVKYLNQSYHIVVANPPYMGSKGMNSDLTEYAKEFWPNSKHDLFSMFVERILYMVPSHGYAGLMTPFTWMFLSSYENFRDTLISNNCIESLVKPEYHSFFDSAYVPICTFVLGKYSNENYLGTYIDLGDFYGASIQPVKTIEAIQANECSWKYRVSSSDLRKIPGAPIAFWLSDELRKAFIVGEPVSEVAPPKQGIKTGKNDLFLRQWFEVDFRKTNVWGEYSDDKLEREPKWYACSKGGAFRKWYGNYEFVLDWEDDGFRIRNFKNADGKVLSRPQNTQYFFKGGITWSTITVSDLSMRVFPKNFTFESTGSICPVDNEVIRNKLLLFMNSSVINKIISAISPTLNYGEGSIGKLPFLSGMSIDDSLASELIDLSKKDWDSHELSWDFKKHRLVNICKQSLSLEDGIEILIKEGKEISNKAHSLEKRNNEFFINAYGLKGEVESSVPMEKITLFCNPYYRYGEKNASKYKELITKDTITSLISYFVGCAFGRYSLEVDGLYVTNPDDFKTAQQLIKGKGEFEPDLDNVIPILSDDWFLDDISLRFYNFLKMAFGEENLENNIRLIEETLGKKIRQYFLKDFYKDHVKTYKKRPIYWLFSSSKGSFNALIYIHRYTTDQVSIVLNDYLRELKAKIVAKREHLEGISGSSSASQSEKTKATKEIEKLKKIIVELDDYEREVLYPLASEKIEIDLDDGVKVNYPKFGKALKKVPGLS